MANPTQRACSRRRGLRQTALIHAMKNRVTPGAAFERVEKFLAKFPVDQA